MITVYAIDFLRTEYERKRGANQRYLMDDALATLGQFSISDIQVALTNEWAHSGQAPILKMSQDELRAIVMTPDLLDLNMWEGQSGRAIFKKACARLNRELPALVCTGFMSYKQYRLAKKILSQINEDTWLMEWIAGSNPDEYGMWLSFELSTLIEALSDAHHRRDYWHRDWDLQGRIDHYREQKKALTQ